MSSRRHSMRPVIVEVKPDRVPTPTIAPSSPRSAKRVQFASENESSRPLTSTEAWSLYHFENHAKHCPSCYDPLEVYLRNGQLCSTGHGLAQDVACHVYSLNGKVYSATKEDSKDSDSKLVHVEVPRGYSQLRLLLQSFEHKLRSRRQQKRQTPLISYDRTYPIPSRKSWSPATEAESVYIEPAKSSSPSHRRTTTTTTTTSAHRPARYSTILIAADKDIEDVSSTTSKLSRSSSLSSSSSSSSSSPGTKDLRRGTLYSKELQRKPKKYTIEVREPYADSSSPSSSKESSRRRRRDSGVYF